MNAIIEQATQKGFKRIIGEYIPTAKNKMVKDLFLSFGFDPIIPNRKYSFYQELPIASLLTFITQ
jgi:predicted enzyme involved in methoxymalonyl-ACP biosynthesis